MFTPQQYRAKADQYQELGKQTAVANEVREFQALERSFATLADNEEWLQTNSDKTVRGKAADHPADPALAAEEEHILRSLGAAVILQWSKIPRKLQRELFDSAGSMGSLLQTKGLRAQLARFLHRHKD